jgi:hypothetical protein
MISSALLMFLRYAIGKVTLERDMSL